MRTYEYFEAFAPDYKLDVFFAKDGFLCVDRWAEERFEGFWRDVVESGDGCILELAVEHTIVLGEIAVVP